MGRKKFQEKDISPIYRIAFQRKKLGALLKSMTLEKMPQNLSLGTSKLRACKQSIWQHLEISSLESEWEKMLTFALPNLCHID